MYLERGKKQVHTIQVATAQASLLIRFIIFSFLALSSQLFLFLLCLTFFAFLRKQILEARYYDFSRFSAYSAFIYLCSMLFNLFLSMWSTFIYNFLRIFKDICLALFRCNLFPQRAPSSSRWQIITVLMASPLTITTGHLWGGNGHKSGTSTT